MSVAPRDAICTARCYNSASRPQVLRVAARECTTSRHSGDWQSSCRPQGPELHLALSAPVSNGVQPWLCSGLQGREAQLAANLALATLPAQACQRLPVHTGHTEADEDSAAIPKR